ncbi:hypothetical protein ACIPY3_15895 [Paenarthrobacter sp. NPDC089714]|uniref:hypothetical protein n=1 Tax=unclassified Paenarthrobacter TaxID=2634190 RepID=UPI0037F766AC
MSISITHRVLANAFGRRTTTYRQPAPVHAPEQDANQGSVSCAPWEGLYLEPEASLGQELDAFLAGLLHGE